MALLLLIARMTRIVSCRIGFATPDRQRGASLLGMVIAVPLFILSGMAIVQFGMLYIVRDNFNHAVLMAARAGAVAHANLETIQQAYVQALVPRYVDSLSGDELFDAKIRAKDVVTGSNDGGENPRRSYARIVLENPTRQSFSDWNSPLLQYTVGAGSRVIPHSAPALRAAGRRDGFGQSFQEANLISLRITQGYQPTIPWMGRLYNRYLARQDDDSDTTYTDLLGRGLIPLVATVTLQMQSDAIERLTVPHPGANDCIAINHPDGCLPSRCRPGDIQCDPVCKPPALCAMPELSSQ
ncbi:TadE/TadG family type IV pilus assembly protein [Actimicrobium sp. CCC2.4]|uniref:TadE/TadG family type IV pilus assembly protein n=1 Tax=Actimicrobium sp. CCC2.4 TaxID=3048606 RepID=UPI002AC9D08A|nr:TadE/TadG family type IV pilus assembly protein [Actimicrobium sp. CCC2.4]MEB0136604.1 TadE/TadG family type IV pilus assembly protein [Actimicrobium sp. CCC2.4]WPX31710.1 TadE/TadG family type IV pilus assembly protein [Actimicrobium sp. CCC2.4]